MIKEIIKIDIDQIVEIGEYRSMVEYNMNRIRDSPRYNQNYRNDFRRANFRGNLRINQNYRGQKYRGGYQRNCRNDNYGRGRSRSRENSFQIMPEGTTEVVVIGLDQVQELVLIEIGLEVISVGSIIILLKTVQLNK